MARTPLFRELQHIVNKAWWARQQGLAESVQRDIVWDRWSMNRRQLLQRSLGAAALASAPLLRPDAPAEARSPKRQPEDIAIIGAGIAGLHCAFRLKEAGVRAQVFEAGMRVGGRILSGRGLFDKGQVVELGGEFIDSNHLCTLALIDEFGLPLDDVLTNDPPGVTPEFFFFEGRVISEEEIVALFEPLAIVMAETMAAAEVSDEVFDEVDAMSIAEWLEANGADPLIRRILEVAYTAEFGLEADVQSAFNLLCFIDFEVLEPFRIFGDSDERFRIHEGNDLLTTELAWHLPDQITLEMRLVAVTERADGRFRLTFVGPAGQTRTIHADRVVFALPFSTLREVDLHVTLPEDKQRVIRELGYGTNAKVSGAFTSRIWLKRFESAGKVITDNGLQQLWDGTDGQPGRSGVLTRFVGGNAGIDMVSGSADDQMQAVLPLIDEIFPGTAAAFIPQSAVRTHWPSMPLFQGSYAGFRRGQTAFFGIEGRREGRLHFCGEHTSGEFQGFMEGGTESGARVAVEILEELGINPPEGLRRMVALNRRAAQYAPPQGNQLRRMNRRRRPGFRRRSS